MKDAVFSFISHALAACAMYGCREMPRSRAGRYVYLVLLTHATSRRGADNAAWRPVASMSALRGRLRASFGPIRSSVSSATARVDFELSRRWACRAAARVRTVYADRLDAYLQSGRYRFG